MKACPRYRWGDLKPGKPFEIIIDKFLDATFTYYNRYIVFKSFLDIGIDKEDIRECEFSIPIRPFLRAFQERPLQERLKMRDKKMLIKIIKVRWNRMQIKSMEEVTD